MSGFLGELPYDVGNAMGMLSPNRVHVPLIRSVEKRVREESHRGGKCKECGYMPKPPELAAQGLEMVAGTVPETPAADINGDGAVTIEDIRELIQIFATR